MICECIIVARRITLCAAFNNSRCVDVYVVRRSVSALLNKRKIKVEFRGPRLALSAAILVGLGTPQMAVPCLRLVVASRLRFRGPADAVHLQESVLVASDLA